MFATQWVNFDSRAQHTIATDPKRPAGVAVDSLNNHIYWPDLNRGLIVDGGTVVAANLDGSNQHTIATNQDGPNGVAVDTAENASGHPLFWADHGSAPNTGTIVAAHLDGTDQQTITTGQAGPAGVAEINDSAPVLFWANCDAGTIIMNDPPGRGQSPPGRPARTGQQPAYRDNRGRGGPRQVGPCGFRARQPRLKPANRRHERAASKLAPWAVGLTAPSTPPTAGAAVAALWEHRGGA